LALVVLSVTLGCGSRPTRETFVPYRELGDEFLPAAIEMFQRSDDAAITCDMLWVTYVLEARIPTEDDEYSAAQVLVVGRGKYADDTPVWKLMLLDRQVIAGRWEWKFSFRKNITDAEDNFSGVKVFSEQPTWEEFTTYVEKAKLPMKLQYYTTLLSARRSQSRRYYVKARPYAEELRELYGRVPPALAALAQEIYVDEVPAPTRGE
jgi:hypothetical protein